MRTAVNANAFGLGKKNAARLRGGVRNQRYLLRISDVRVKFWAKFWPRGCEPAAWAFDQLMPSGKDEAPKQL